MEKKRISGITAFKVIAYIVLILSSICCVVSATAIFAANEMGLYMYSVDTVIGDVMNNSYYSNPELLLLERNLITELDVFKYVVIYALVGSIILCILMTIFLTFGAGHRKGSNEVTPCFAQKIFFDVSTVIMVVLLCASFGLFTECIIREIRTDNWVFMLIMTAILFVASETVGLLWYLDLVVRIKIGGWWKNTLIAYVIRLIIRALKACGRGILWLCSTVPTIYLAVLIFIGFNIPELVILMIDADDFATVMIWFLWKLIEFAGVVFLALCANKLLEAGRKIREGDEEYRVDTKYLYGPFKEHGENLNDINQGITGAVEARMKSEHMKTELITNVSHDIKTPLTSIINYAGFLGNLGNVAEANDPATEYIRVEKAKYLEYTEVLLRQSTRMKKLLEDLVEASKATTGNLEVNLAPCEVGVLLTQAAGEYEQRMAERGLELRCKQPETSIHIMADGRRLWRVFDNLLSNICKYAEDHSRVYLSLEKQGDNVVIIFRNISKYPLDITPEELEERFVRGDKSRHMEGNGLGLSIAKSLVELQNGKMEIVVDGDLFKVILTFPTLQ